MRIRTLTIEDILYILAFGLAVGLRLFQLGAAPLTDTEASWALQALDLYSGRQPQLGAQPAYILLTGLSFTIFNSTNFLARLLPALAGSLFVLLPALIRPLIGDAVHIRWAGVILAIGFAADPGLVALSRTAGSLIPALAFGMLALVLFARRWMVLAGIAAGLAVLSGPALLHGGLILALGWGAHYLVNLLQRHIYKEGMPKLVTNLNLPPLERNDLRKGLIALGITLFCIGLLFLRFPQGLAALAATLPEYLRSWVTPSGIPLLRLPGALLIYQAPVVLFALLATWRGWQSIRHGGRVEQLITRLSLWVLVGLLVTMFYPARQVADLAWVLIPLWGLAALELPKYFPGKENRPIRLAAIGLTILLCILAVVVWVNLLDIGRFQVNLRLYWIVISGVVALGLITIIMMATGWSIVSARLGSMWALGAILTIGMLSGMLGMVYLRPQAAQELWNTPPATGQVDLLLETVKQLSRTTTGHDNQIKIVLLNNSPALRWVLRHFPYLTSADQLARSEAPPIVITGQEQQTPTLAQRYRGQDLIWRTYPVWDNMTPPQFITWLAFRQVPITTENIIIWARSDLFPGEVEMQSGETVPASP